ncbi:transposase family protein [Marichromatium sp. AB32]|nr:transposase family protein [Marichromatium sp. AB32]
MRDHWGIENTLHWSLDVTFGEDASRVRDPGGRENLARLRRLALTRLKQDSARLSIKGKRQKAGWDARYLFKLIFEAPDKPEKSTPSREKNISKG